MNVIRFMTEHEYFGGQKFVKIIETNITPLLKFAEDPTKIDFEDDLIFFIDSLIKKSQNCSEIYQEIFPYLKKFQVKYKGMLANLTSCLSSYLFFGSEFIIQNQVNVDVFMSIISDAISLKPIGADEVNYSNNIEGCLVLQLAF